MALAAWLWRPSPLLPFDERDWVLVAGIENRTGEEVFDGTLEHALERELTNSRFANVVPRERVHDSLLLMRLPLDSPLNPALAREVALRDGGVRALVAGRIEKLDSTYLVSLSLINPADGVTVAAFSGEAAGHAQVISTIRKLSHKLRRSVGENLNRIQASEQLLEKVTTPSLRALQYYTLGMRLVNEYQWSEAVEFLERAVGEDPTFASAHILLAHCLSNLGRNDAAAPHYLKAFALADSTIDHERYFILGSFYQRFEQDNDKAVLAYKSLLEVHPDHFWGNNNLYGTYRAMGQPLLAQRYFVATARLRPNDFWRNYNAATWLMASGNDAEDVNLFVDRMRQSISPGDFDQLSALRIIPVSRAWLRGEREVALSELERIVGEMESLPDAERDALSNHPAAAYFAIGKLGRAKELLHPVDSSNFASRLTMAMLALAENRPGIIMAQVELLPPSFFSVLLLAKIGQLEAAQEMYANLVASGAAGVGAFNPEPKFVRKIAQGELAFARGEMDEAILLITDSRRDRLLGYTLSIYEHLAADTLALAWEADGDLLKAAEALETSARDKAPHLLFDTAFFSMNNKLKLAGIHRKLGNSPEAERIEAELRDWLAHADPDHPILVGIAD
jgi:tetratricopeptide (TPR) repeat protein